MNNIVMMPYGSTLEVTKEDFYNQMKTSPFGYEIDRTQYLFDTDKWLYRAKYRDNGFAHRKNEGEVIGYIIDSKYYIAQWFITWKNKNVKYS